MNEYRSLERMAIQSILHSWLKGVVANWRICWQESDHRHGKDFAAFVGESLLSTFSLRDVDGVIECEVAAAVTRTQSVWKENEQRAIALAETLKLYQVIDMDGVAHHFIDRNLAIEFMNQRAVVTPLMVWCADHGYTGNGVMVFKPEADQA